MRKWMKNVLFVLMIVMMDYIIFVKNVIINFTKVVSKHG
jgi:hypothetical protein